jgi:hypothetical protein
LFSRELTFWFWIDGSERLRRKSLAINCGRVETSRYRSRFLALKGLPKLRYGFERRHYQLPSKAVNDLFRPLILPLLAARLWSEARQPK